MWLSVEPGTLPSSMRWMPIRASLSKATSGASCGPNATRCRAIRRQRAGTPDVRRPLYIAGARGRAGRNPLPPDPSAGFSLEDQLGPAPHCGADKEDARSSPIWKPSKVSGYPLESFGDLSYGRTQEIGDAAAFLGFDGIIAPSARWPCQNLVIFSDSFGPPTRPSSSSSRSTGMHGAKSALRSGTAPSFTVPSHVRRGLPIN